MKKSVFLYLTIFILLISALLLSCADSNAQQAGESQIKRAQIYIQNNDFEMAVKILEGLTANGGGDIDVFYLLGLSYRGMKNYPKAEEAFRNVITKDSRCEPGYIQLTTVLIEQNKLGEAEKVVGQFLRLSPKSAQAHYAAGVIFYAQKETLKAIREFKEATLCDTKYAPAYGNMGVTYYSRGQYKEALENFEKAAMFDPLTPRYLFFAGWTCRTMGIKDKSISYFRRSSNIQAPSVYSVTWKIIQAWDSNDMVKVDACLKELDAIEKDFEKGLYFRGLIAINAKKYDEAESFYKKMLEQDPLDRDALEQINKIKKLREENSGDSTTPSATTTPAPTPSGSPTSVPPPSASSSPAPDGKEKKEDASKDGEKQKDPGKTDYDLGIPIPKPDSEK
ncbi:MAG: tetratricopeptide repeat protein [Firmicutes bacterium]|nr:tetratricopeptide repeat protein [Bacillota bacterium]